jgi:hypothetical protein
MNTHLKKKLTEKLKYHGQVIFHVLKCHHEIIAFIEDHRSEIQELQKVVSRQ